MSGSIAIGWFGPTNDHWEWILGHFREVTLLTDRNVEDWVLLQSNAMRSDKLVSRHMLLVAIESRFDSAVDFVTGFEQTVSPTDSKEQTIPRCVLLGDDWAGHRRTYPLPESLQTFYWYELYDRLLPWIPNASPTSTESSANSVNAAGKRKTSPRVQRLIDVSLSLDRKQNDGKSGAHPVELALVVTETATTRQLWCEAFTRYAIQCIATTPAHFEFWVKPDVVVIDVESEPWVVRQRNLDLDSGTTGCLVRKIAAQFPEAIIVVADAFPRWENWKMLKKFGADILVGKPFQLAGIRSSLLAMASNRS